MITLPINALERTKILVINEKSLQLQLKIALSTTLILISLDITKSNILNILKLLNFNKAHTDDDMSIKMINYKLTVKASFAKGSANTSKKQANKIKKKSFQYKKVISNWLKNWF